jgi:cytoskeletal protein RodZ
MIRRTSQGGSIASFVVIGVILLAGLLAAVYFVNLRGQQARKDQAISSTNTQNTTKTGTTSTETKNNTTKTSSNSSKTTTTTSKSQGSNLPATGPETSIGSMISVFLLTVSIGAYLTSRRAAGRSL